MKLVLLWLFLAAAYAQTTRYPASVDNDASLFVVSDNVQTTINTAMAVGDSTAVVSSAAGFAPNMIVTICDTSTNTGKCTAWEHMLVTGVSGNVLTVTRGFAGTSPRAHSTGRLLSALIDSAHQKVLKDAVVAIETALGPNLGNLSLSFPFLSVTGYSFSPYSCNSSSACAPGGSAGMSLIAGNNTLTMTPVPLGVNGTDTNHSLYVSGGTGTPEGCLITGGAGSSGQPSGQIIINCTSAHSGAFSIQSVAGGIPEAVQAAASMGGNSVLIPAGAYTARGTTVIPSKVRVVGSGRSNTTITAAGVSTSRWWAAPTTAYSVFTAASADSIELASLTVNLGTPGVALSGFSGVGLTNSRIRDIAVSNPWQGGISTPINLVAGIANYANLIEGNYLYLGGGCADNAGAGGINLNNAHHTRVTGNYVEGGCATVYGASNGRDNAFIGNSFRLQGGTMSAGNQAYSADSASRTSFIGNTCYGNGTGPACFTTAADSDTQDDPNDNLFQGNIAANCGYGFLLTGSNPAARTSRRNVVDGNTVSGCRSGIYIQPGAIYPGSIEGLTISNNTITASVEDGIQILAATAGVTLRDVVIQGNQISANGRWGIDIFQNVAGAISHLTIANNVFNHNGGATQNGGVIFNSGAGMPVSDVTITGNIFTDTYVTSAGTYHILFNTSDNHPRYHVAGNIFSGPQIAAQWPGSDISKMQSSYIAGNSCSALSGCAGLWPGLSYTSPQTFARLGACAANNAGSTATITDGSVNTWGTTVAGGGANKVLVLCNGTSWTVAGK